MVNPNPVRQSKTFQVILNEKIKCEISQLYVTLMNDFDKTFVFTLLILFRNKIKL